MPDQILIIEDEPLLGDELSRQFRRDGWEVDWVKTLAQARRFLASSQPRPLLVLADLSLPDGSSLDLLEQLHNDKGPTEWIFITGYGGVPDSVRALRLGAYDFLVKRASGSVCGWSSAPLRAVRAHSGS